MKYPKNFGHYDFLTKKTKQDKRKVRLKAVLTKTISWLSYHNKKYLILFLKHDTLVHISDWRRGLRRRDRVVVGFTITRVISAYHQQRCEFEPCSGEVYSIQQ